MRNLFSKQNIFEKARAEIKSVVMTAAEKQTMLSKITGIAAPVSIPNPSPYFSDYWVMIKTRIQTYHRPIAYVMAAFLIVILTSGSVALAAENSLPGDALYPIKVNVVEPIRASLAVSPEAKARVAASLAEERLHEAETLAKEGKLDDSKQEQIQKLLDKHSTDLNQALTALDEKNKHDETKNNEGVATSTKNSNQNKDVEEISKKFEHDMNTHAAFIETIATSTATTEKHQIDDIANSARHNADLIIQNSEQRHGHSDNSSKDNSENQNNSKNSGHANSKGKHSD